MKDRFPRLPPGCTPSDIDRQFGERKCTWCNRPEMEGHAPGCPSEEDYCDVCHPPPDRYRTEDPTFCSSHDEEDLQLRREAEGEAARGESPVIIPEDERERTE